MRRVLYYRSKHLLCWTIVLLGSVFGQSAFGATIVLKDELSGLPVEEYLEFQIDESNQLGITSVADNRLWRNYSSAALKYTDGTVWFKTAIKNTSASSQTLFLKFSITYFETVDFYLESDSDQAGRQFLESKNGFAVPLAQRHIKDTQPIFQFNVDPDETRHLYLKIKTPANIRMPMTLSTQRNFVRQRIADLNASVIFYGIVLGIALYNLYLMRISNTPVFGFYSLHILLLAICASAVDDGIIYRLWPESWNDYRYDALIISAAVSVIFALLFFERFLDIRQFGLKHQRFVQLLVLVLVTSSFLLLITSSYPVFSKPVMLVTGIAYLYQISMALVAIKNKHDNGWLFLCATMVLAAAIVMNVLSMPTVAIIGGGFNGISTVLYGSVIQMIILSAGLGRTMFVHKRQALDALEESYLLKTQAEGQERERQRLHNEAAQKSELLAAMSHELRTPINGIIGMADIMQDGKLDPEQQELLSTLSNSGNNLLQVINNILDYSKIDAGKMCLENMPFSLKALLTRATNAVCDDLAAEVTLTYSTSDAIADQLIGDQFRLEQILHNLLDNAVRYTKKGSITISVTKNSSTKQEHQDSLALNFMINDTGPGIAEHKLTCLFEIGTHDESSNSTGLGLPICKQLAALMGGDIQVACSAGGGTMVHLLLPIRTSDASSQPASNVLPERHSTSNEILIAEDNVVNQKVARAMLLNMGFKATVVPNGALALATYASNANHYRAILMDCDMPVMDGYEATRQIRAFEEAQQLQPIRIIALTAFAPEEHLAKGRLVGIDGYLNKPITRHSLLQVLSQQNIEAQLN